MLGGDAESLAFSCWMYRRPPANPTSSVSPGFSPAVRRFQKNRFCLPEELGSTDCPQKLASLHVRWGESTFENLAGRP